MRLSRSLLCGILSLLAAMASVAVVRAQEEHQHDHQHDASEKLGQVSFPVSCNAATQKQFNRALALLHSFQYVEAGQAFAEIAAREPSCAMAEWGVAMSNYHPLWTPPTAAELQKGREAIERAKAARARTQREQDYIAALATFYQDSDKLGHYERARAYAAAMERLSRRWPQDREAAIFYALSLNGAAPASEGNLANRRKAAQILYRIWPREPRHPGIAHYLIHSYDYPQLARLALPAARRYARVAPSSAHALHMPSHIFTRLGLWEDSIQSNLASAATAKQKANKTHPGAASQDQLHAMDYLAYAYLQTAQDEKAKSVLAEALNYSTIDQEVFQAAYAWAAIPARLALERHRWSEAASLTLHPASFPGRDLVLPKQSPISRGRSAQHAAATRQRPGRKLTSWPAFIRRSVKIATVMTGPRRLRFSARPQRPGWRTPKAGTMKPCHCCARRRRSKIQPTSTRSHPAQSCRRANSLAICSLN